MTSISVYGYEPDMLAAVNALRIEEESPKQIAKPPGDLVRSSAKEDQTTCHLLSLPYELRCQIYRCIMPTTILVPTGVVWFRATAPIWVTCRMIYRECIGMLYSDCTFDVNVTYEDPTFRHKWFNTKSKYPKMVLNRNLQFPQIIPSRYRNLIRRIRVVVNQVGSYEGMIKFNYSNPESLALGVKAQVQKLCDVLKDVPEIRDLVIVYNGHWNEDPEMMRLVLGPFRMLRNTRNVALLQCESIDPTFAPQLEKKLTDAYTRNSILSLPTQVRAEIYRQLLPYSPSSGASGVKAAACRSGDLSIMRTCKLIYAETSQMLYQPQLS